MILRELFYFDSESVKPVEDDSYDPQWDQSPVDYDDTRKTRLSLSQINRIRKASDFHNQQKDKELNVIRQMYGKAANASAGTI